MCLLCGIGDAPEYSRAVRADRARLVEQSQSGGVTRLGSQLAFEFTRLSHTLKRATLYPT